MLPSRSAAVASAAIAGEMSVAKAPCGASAKSTESADASAAKSPGRSARSIGLPGKIGDLAPLRDRKIELAGRPLPILERLAVRERAELALVDAAQQDHALVGLAKPILRSVDDAALAGERDIVLHLEQAGIIRIEV